MYFNKITKYVILSMFLTFFLFYNFSYATENQTEWTATFTYVLVSLFDLISSIWYILPIIAWKLLTNDLLYWNSLHLDVLLWNIWNFSRSLANFLIGFLFIYFIFKFIVASKDASLIKTNLPKIAFWAIVINASWFIIGILIDISTILIAWFGSLPLAFSDLGSGTKVAIPKNITFDSTKCHMKNNGCFNWSFSIIATWDNDINLNQLQSYETYISWPLFFMWANILGINTSKEHILNNAYDVNSLQFKHNWAAIKAIIQIILILFFTIPIIVLIVVNVIRVFWVWIYIWFSPLIFLDQIFWWKIANQQKAFSFKNMIWLILQPAIVILVFSISVIFIYSIYWSLVDKKVFNTQENSKKYEENVKKVFLLDNSTNSIVYLTWFWQIQDTSNKTEYIWWFFSYLIVSIIVIIFLWTLIKMSFKATEITSSISGYMFQFSENLMKTIDFIPTPLGVQSIWSFTKLWNRVSSLHTNISSKQSEKLANIFWTIPDIGSVKVKQISENLWSNQSKLKLEWFNQALQELQTFKNKQIVNNRENAKKIIDVIISKLPDNFSIKDELNKEKDYEEKLNIILWKQNEIKKYI